MHVFMSLVRLACKVQEPLWQMACYHLVLCADLFCICHVTALKCTPRSINARLSVTKVRAIYRNIRAIYFIALCRAAAAFHLVKAPTSPCPIFVTSAAPSLSESLGVLA